MSDLSGESIDGECGELLKKYFLGTLRNGYKRYRGVTLPSHYGNYADKVENFEVRNEDVWVISYPKTGTTWTQEMVWCIMNNLDFEKAKEFLPERFPFLEFTCLFDYSDVIRRKPDINLPPFVKDSLNFINNLKSTRFIKTHLPWDLLPVSIRKGDKQPKIIYVCRNAKDTCVSYFHHTILLEGYTGNFNDFCKLFLEDSVCFSPFWSHIEGFWKRRNQSNVLFIKYEDMKENLAGVIEQTAQFLDKKLSPEQIKTLCHHLSFESMKNNPSVNYEAILEVNRIYNLIPADGEFMRKGTGGEWKEKMPNEIVEKFNKWIETNLKERNIQL
ncbi:conserved hypothetical protein [Pediculus humanus corporis]|uniref:Sulfotransferase domain-containing protein n=1 Tax=Pediculus humanus subsp. corporis TaxID=121224 RepID=E0VMA7_PEDHC|nr:uncharacterized protein Phum_PHUM307230 [Pediculus humanus corporis]EEB14513.1 conserved hypothetical protein [Pediculus humanus corporis]